MYEWRALIADYSQHGYWQLRKESSFMGIVTFFSRKNTRLGVLIGCLIAISAVTACTKKPGATLAQNSTVAITVAPQAVTIATNEAAFTLQPSGYLRAVLKNSSEGSTLDDSTATPKGASISVHGQEVNDLVLDLTHATVTDAHGKIGKLGKRVEVEASSPGTGLQETLAVEVYDDLPTMAFSSVSFKNTGNADLEIERTAEQQHVLNASLSDPKASPYQMWSFHGSSEAWGKDDVMPVSAKFSRANPMQQIMRNDENMTGGGLPIVAFWTRNLGEAVGHVELLPLQLALPVRTSPDGKVNVGLTMDNPARLAPGETFSMPMSFVSVFHGDFYEALKLYSAALQSEGWNLAKPNQADYEANWCGWGYEMEVTPKQMLDTIPKLKELGLKWTTLDAGWFNNRGDWQPRQKTFPADSVKKVVDAYHKAGMKMTIWWIPIVVEDGGGKDILNHRPYQLSEVVKEHPDWLILDKDGKPARTTANLGALCPALPEVQEYYKQVTTRFIKDWDFDGHKLDFSYTVPRCYNPKHHHKSPGDSTNAMGGIYKIIFETTRALKPESVTQACPCGTPPNFAWLPYIDQAVTADPVGSRQVRLRTKMYKALLGPKSAVYGDHVELTDVRHANSAEEIDIGKDFASTIGAGAVLGTKFTWPDNDPRFKLVELTQEKEKHWRKWIDIYNAKKLSDGTFKDLYVYGYDTPEAYAIEKNGTMYYAFYSANEKTEWKGDLELRGLAPGKYKVTDYAENKDLGTVDSSDPHLHNVTFKEHILIEVSKL
jgi:alpha-galactosidase